MNPGPMKIACSKIATAFHEALCLAGLGASGLALGCGVVESGTSGELSIFGDPRSPQTSDGPSGRVADDPAFAEIECGISRRYPEPLYLGDLQPAFPADYLELRSAGGVLLESVGTPCVVGVGDGDAQGCRAELDAVPDTRLVLGHIVQVVNERRIAATRGTAVELVRDTRELRAFLGSIDAPGDAALLVASQNYSLVCGESGVVPKAAGFDVLAFTYEGCDGRTRHLLNVDAEGTIASLDRFVELTPDPYCVVGRRPALSRARERSSRRRSLASFFSHCAELEAASVAAFVELSGELEAHGAPRALRVRARSAALDEVRHARSVARLARAFGGRPRRAPFAPTRPRALEAVALDNAVEGCVRETYGALVGHHVRARAELPAVARTYGPIARDETRHAQLSWDIACWAEARLGVAARARVRRARHAEAEALVERLRSAQPTAIDEDAGLPAPDVGVRMAEHLQAGIWRA